MQKLVERNHPVVAVMMRNPYDVRYYPEVPACIAAYEYSYPAMFMTAKAIFGLEIVKGKLPVSIAQPV